MKVSTIYESAGAGFILPPCPPSQYPYPLAVVGSYRGDVATRWSDVSDRHRGISSPYERSCYLRDPAGRWLGFTVEGGLALLARLQTITPNQGYRTDAGTRVLSGWFNELVKERHEGFPLIVVQPGKEQPPEHLDAAVRFHRGFDVVGAVQGGYDHYEEALEDLQLAPSTVKPSQRPAGSRR